MRLRRSVGGGEDGHGQRAKDTGKAPILVSLGRRAGSCRRCGAEGDGCEERRLQNSHHCDGTAARFRQRLGEAGGAPPAKHCLVEVEEQPSCLTGGKEAGRDEERERFGGCVGRCCLHTGQQRGK